MGKAKKGKYRHTHWHWKIFLFLGISLIALATTFGSLAYYYGIQHYVDSSLTGEEVLETQQNTVPKDVLAQVQKDQHVLGVNTKSPVKPLTIHIPILMYHYVEYVQDINDKTRLSLNTTPYTLEQEIKTLRSAGYTFMTNNELTRVLDGKIQLPSNPILLTFDDGYGDFYTGAYPILKKYNVKATQYAIAGFLDRPNHLTTAELEEIAQSGLVEIGAHTVDHLWLKGQPLARVSYEVSKSKEILEQIIHKPVISFAYPFGAFDLQALTAVKDAGFTSALSTIPGIDQSQTNRYFLYRLRPGGRVGNNLLAWLSKTQNN